MNLYIETEDGVTKNHPAFEDNLIQAFGSVPERWEPFIRVEHPLLGAFEVYEGVSYAKVDGVWTDVHNVRPMTDEEKALMEKIEKNIEAGFEQFKSGYITISEMQKKIDEAVTKTNTEEQFNTLKTLVENLKTTTDAQGVQITKAQQLKAYMKSALISEEMRNEVELEF